MKEITGEEIERMIDAVAEDSRRREMERIRPMVNGLDSGMGEWIARRRRNSAIAATLLLLAVPPAYAMLLPQRHADNVVCNMTGGRDAVLGCANQIIANV